MSEERTSARSFTYLTAVVSGAAIMIVEILGARMLAPFVGTSHFVWTAQIGVTLLALAVGYAFGGWLVDRSESCDRLYLMHALAAVYLALTVPFCRPIALRLVDFGLEAGSVLISLVLFFPPLMLLAVTGPFLVRMATDSLHVLGRTAGVLSALSTAGSVAGTALIGYYLIPNYPSSVSMLTVAAVLFLLATAYFIFRIRKSSVAEAFFVFFGLLLLLVVLFRPWRYQGEEWQSREIIHEAASAFGDLQVVREKEHGYLYLFNDYLQQNSYDPATQQSLSVFSYMLRELAWAYFDAGKDDDRRINRVLVIGLGVGIVPMEFARDAASVDVVEINPAMLPVAEKFFDFDRKSVDVFIEDGRTFLNRSDKKYDVVIIDAFLGDSSPAHLMTVEAFKVVSEHLTTGGLLVINSFSDFRQGKDYMAQSLFRTLKAAFKSVEIHEAVTAKNAFYVASNEPLIIRGEPDLAAVHPSCRKAVLDAFNRRIVLPERRSSLLTDDYNPVEFYDAKNREERRRLFLRNFNWLVGSGASAH